MNQKSGGAEKQRDGDTEPMRSKKTKAQRFLAKPLVRRRNRSRTGAESALRVNSARVPGKLRVEVRSLLPTRRGRWHFDEAVIRRPAS